MYLFVRAGCFRWDRLSAIKAYRDTLPGRKSRSFCLSRVVGTLRNAAWPRLGAHRSGQGKARNLRIHSCICFLGGAMPVAGSMPCAKGRMAHNLRLASWEPGTPASFDATPLGTYPQGRRLFLSSVCVLLHFLKPYSRWCRAFATANSLVRLEQHGGVFTYGPSPYNPYTLQFSRC
jgi:hypothetical protein